MGGGGHSSTREKEVEQNHNMYICPATDDPHQLFQHSLRMEP